MISVIVAVAKNGVIGDANNLIWHIGEDLRRFKAITSGHPVVMGRKTFESLGRPLPNRVNVVVTRRTDYAPEGVLVASSLEDAIRQFDPLTEIFIIGGGEIYTQAMPMADKFYLTVVDREYAGDTRFPQWDASQWEELSREEHPRGEKFEYPFTFVNYLRRR